MGTFHGLEMAKRAMFTQQSAIHTTGHNIANANTKGYTRQRVNFQTTTPYPVPGRNQPQIPGQIGTGVEAGSIDRIRTQYLDAQYRSENSKAGYWNTATEAFSRMEELMNEPSENGLSHTMNEFWDALQVLGNNPENTGARSVVAQRGQAVAETFNYISNTLESIRSDLNNQIDVTVKDANSLIERIGELNQQIQQIEPHGYVANDLYDERDRLIDELSQIVNIEVSYRKSSPSSKDNADGIATIELIGSQGEKLGVKLVDGEKGELQKLTYNNTDPSSVSVGEMGFPISGDNGSLNALIHAYDDHYPEMKMKMDEMAKVLQEQFNAIHQAGYDLNGENGVDFFKGETSGDLEVNPDILKDPTLIAVSGRDDKKGDGSNALKLAEILYEPLENTALGENTSINGFYQALIGEMGVKAQKANTMAKNTDILKTQIDGQRMSVSSVSLDEEISNLIKFQHAYNAAARNITTIDEMIDRIINGMGIVGR